MTGTIVEIRRGDHISFYVQSQMSRDLRIGQSVAHDGACLTIVSVQRDVHEVHLSEETLQKTHFQYKKPGSLLNLERAVTPSSFLDGHLVLGHVDTVALCVERKELTHSVLFRFRLSEPSPYVIEKGCIAVNGISLTPFEVTEDAFSVAIIPHTLANTNLKEMKVEDWVNIEFDVIGKYVERMLSFRRMRS